MGDSGGGGGGPVGAAYLPPAESFEAGAVPPRPEEAAGGADEDHGQRGHVLHVADALHIHFQVQYVFLPSSKAAPQVETHKPKLFSQLPPALNLNHACYSLQKKK